MIEKHIPGFLDLLYQPDVAKLTNIEEIRDAFHTNQILSKNTASDAFDTIALDATEVLYIGSWFGFLTHHLAEQHPNVNFTEIDLDMRCNIISQKFNYMLNNYRGHHTADINSFDRQDNYDTIINLSCEHMDTQWFDRIKPGTKMVLQSNNLLIDDHVNNCKSLDEFKFKYPFTNLKYGRTLKLNVMERYTIAGIK